MVLGSPVVPSIHLYSRLSSSSVPFPNVVVPGHDGAPPQLPKGIQVGQEPTHKPDVHLISVENPVCLRRLGNCLHSSMSTYPAMM